MKLLEAYNIPYSGYVVINSDNQYISKEFKTAKTGRELWTEDIRQAAIWKPELESEAYKMKNWCHKTYGSDEIYVKYVESNDELDKQQILKYIPDLLKAYEQLILAGVDFQKLCKQSDFENFKYTLADYENKKEANSFLIKVINNPDDVVTPLKHFISGVCKNSGLEDTDKELVSRLEKFVGSWNNLVNEWKSIPKSYIQEILTHMSNISKDKKESYKEDSLFSLIEEIKEYNKLWD